MKLDSPWFDRIRVSKATAERPQPQTPRCDHPGCRQPGVHRAPKGRDRENEYWRYCLEHVRAYNQNYNFFSGMSDDAVIAYQKDSQTGHRPTWQMGQNGATATPEARAKAGSGRRGRNRGWAGDHVFEDNFDLFGEQGATPRPEKPKREVRKVELKSLEALNLGAGASREEIRARYKELLIRFHPDTNGGDRGAEDKLREIIQAYNYLRSAGFC
ncbi:J domain-containing protein [Methylopila henanensis]|uniref:J domain-containing protein n=1 Tax=Methylopila henanensis TaxID=873516 RepID=A0ABW4KAM3_9HYPH